jgi:hypothetical protein
VAESRDAPRRTRVRRGEGEVTQWPRGLVAYVGAGPEGTPSVEEDRTRNRILLAARLIAILRAGGSDVDRELADLHAAERAFASHDHDAATEKVEALLARLDARTRSGGPDRPTP